MHTVTNTSNPEFASYALNEEGRQKVQAIRDAFNTLLNTITPICTTGRELAIVKTKLEEASFFAVKSMSVGLTNQVAA